VNPDDIAELGLADGMFVDIRGEYKDGVERMVHKFRVVSYPTARGCAAAYYPEANVLVPLNHTAEGSNTPVSKAVIVRLEPSLDQSPDGSATLASGAAAPAAP
jgi:anaerobic selenocysteine-containing dehydrogenase